MGWISNSKRYTVALEGDTLATSNPIKLDMSAFQSGEDERPHMEHPAWIVLHEGTLFMKKQHYGDIEGGDLYSMDLKTARPPCTTCATCSPWPRIRMGR